MKHLSGLLGLLGRVLRLPIYLLTALFGTGKFIDSLGISNTTLLYNTFIVTGDLFLVGLILLEIEGMTRAWKDWHDV
ncbi:MAG: hypothetical protein HW388_821 [Dehalococcoidia bacterium]|nr:hypothetical protein [Dehalococcoidia bacterium]